MFEFSEQSNFPAGGHAEAAALDLLERILLGVRPVLPLGLVDMAVRAPPHFAALELEQILNFFSAHGRLLFEFIVHFLCFVH